MTHTEPMRESQGNFTANCREQRVCSSCGGVRDHTAQRWESNDGAYEDWKYTCRTCGAVHWVDGIDS